MDLQENKKAVEDLLTAYSNALNSSNAELLAALYAPDGVFMPDGAPILRGGEEIKCSAERFLARKQMNIAFEVKDITIDNSYAFVQATSKCTVHQRSTGRDENTECKDFFVLRNEQQKWIVYRYMFNAVKEN